MAFKEYVWLGPNRRAGHVNGLRNVRVPLLFDRFRSLPDAVPHIAPGSAPLPHIGVLRRCLRTGVERTMLFIYRRWVSYFSNIFFSISVCQR